MEATCSDMFAFQRYRTTPSPRRARQQKTSLRKKLRVPAKGKSERVNQNRTQKCLQRIVCTYIANRRGGRRYATVTGHAIPDAEKQMSRAKEREQQPGPCEAPQSPTHLVQGGRSPRGHHPARQGAARQGKRGGNAAQVAPAHAERGPKPT